MTPYYDDGLLPTAPGAPEEGAGKHVVSDGRALTACWCGDIHMPPMRAAKEQGLRKRVPTENHE